LLDALVAIHRHNFVHRDIRPDNFCVRNIASGKLTLIDVGCALPVNCADESYDTSFAGTIKFASGNVLEHLARGEGEFEVTKADDLESLVKCFCARDFLEHWNKAVSMTDPRPPHVMAQVAWSQRLWTTFVTATYATKHRPFIETLLKLARDNDAGGLRSALNTSTPSAEL